MAKIEFTHSENGEMSASVETIEVRVWGLAGAPSQQFYIGSGLNFNAESNLWLEILYTVRGVPLFYTRNFLHHMGDAATTLKLVENLEKFAAGEGDSFGLGDMLPASGVLLKRTKFDYRGEVISNYSLEISADVGAVFGMDAPDERAIIIQLKNISLDQGITFLRDLIYEIEAAYLGRHPSMDSLASVPGEWTFALELSRQAYHHISQDYQEDYFTNPHLSEMFDSWLQQLPANCRILDVGCGHGNPVITRLLERGHHVTGIDISLAMLQRAREKFPETFFLNLPVTNMEFEAEFDGACSLSSLLYLDPLDLSQSLHRLKRSLKPGGMLFLYAYDTHPSWRGLPYNIQLDQWMWSWTYSMEEAVKAIEEHGLFKVLKTRNVTTKKEKQEIIARWRKRTQEAHEQSVNNLPPDTPAPPPPDLSKPPTNLAYGYAIVARRGD